MLKGMKKSVGRMQQKALSAMGKADTTVDVEFDQHAANFKEHYAKNKKLSKFVRNYEKAVADLSQAQTGIAEMVMDQYENHHAMYGAAVKYEKLSQDIEALRHSLQGKFEEGFHQPIADYLGQYKIMEQRIEERNKRALDMDRSKYELKCMMERGGTEPTRIQIAKEREEMATTAYLSLNSELLRDLPALNSDRSKFFSSLFANVVDGQMFYFSQYLAILGQMEPALSSVDRFEHRGHRWVITDENSSAMKRENATEANTQRPPSKSAVQRQPAAARAAPGGGGGGYGAPAAAAVGGGAAMGAYAAAPAAAPPSYAPAPASAVVQARAKYPFEGQDHTELTFAFNDIIVVHRQGGEWWEGEVGGRRGLFPSNYVELI